MTNTCPICLQRTCETPQDQAYALECGHVFHKSCISRWQMENPSCPLCRTTIPTAPSNIDASNDSEESLEIWGPPLFIQVDNEIEPPTSKREQLTNKSGDNDGLQNNYTIQNDDDSLEKTFSDIYYMWKILYILLLLGSIFTLWWDLSAEFNFHYSLMILFTVQLLYPIFGVPIFWRAKKEGYIWLINKVFWSFILFLVNCIYQCGLLILICTICIGASNPKCLRNLSTVMVFVDAIGMLLAHEVVFHRFELLFIIIK